MAFDLAVAERHRIEYNPQQEGLPANWICMDDRFARVIEGLQELVERPTVEIPRELRERELEMNIHMMDAEHPGLYRQMGGGAAHGGGQDWYVGQALQADANRRPIQPIIDRMPDVHIAAMRTAKILTPPDAENPSVRGWLHTGCAAEGSAGDIAGIIADTERAPELWEAAQALGPGLLSERQLEIGQTAYAAMRKKGAFIEPQKAADTMAQGIRGERQQYPAIPRAALVDMGHIAGDIIADYGQNVAFDAAGALEAGNPAYHISFGDMEEVRKPLNVFTPVSHENWMAATLLRHAGIALALPKPAGQNQLAIHRVGF